jgi:hypothetical protein
MKFLTTTLLTLLMIAPSALANRGRGPQCNDRCTHADEGKIQCTPNGKSIVKCVRECLVVSEQCSAYGKTCEFISSFLFLVECKWVDGLTCIGSDKNTVECV